MKLSEATVGGSFKAIFKGERGTRKSCAALTFPRPMCILDLDGRYKSLINWAKMSGFEDLLQDVEFFTYTRQDLPKFQDKFNLIEATEAKSKYKTVILDSLTSLCDMTIYYGLAQRDKSRNGTKGKKFGDIAVPGWDEYNLESSVLGQTFEIMKNLPCNSIITAHITTIEMEDKQGNKIYKRELFTAGKKAAQKLPNNFDEVFHFEVDQAIGSGGTTKSMVYTDHTPNGWDWAKTALPLPKTIDISNKRLYNVLQDLLREKGVEI